MSAQYFYIFVSNIPFWVFPLFIVLMVLGLQATRDRNVPVRRYWFLPLIGLMALPGLISIGKLEAFAVFALAYSLGALFGRAFQERVTLGFDKASVSVKGEWLTLTAMMVVFFANFVKGAASGMAPELASSLVFILPLVFTTAFFSGTFLGRALGVIGLYGGARNKLLSN